MFWYSGLPSTASRTSASGAWRRMRSSQPALVSSIAAHSSPRGVDAGGVERRRRHLRGDVAEGADAERVGEAPGRVDGEHEHPAALLDGGGQPRAAAIVVLPTPPDPSTSTISLLASSASSRRSSGLVPGPSSTDVQLVGERLGDERDDAAGRWPW